jgi:hypothetical protein
MPSSDQESYSRLVLAGQGSVQAVEPEQLTADGGSAGGGRVLLAGGEVVEYDWLVVALGAETSTFGIEGVEELALPFCTYDDAMKVGRASGLWTNLSTRAAPGAAPRRLWWFRRSRWFCRFLSIRFGVRVANGVAVTPRLWVPDDTHKVAV